MNVLIEATRAGCERIVLTSSMEVPGMDQLGAPPPSPYAAAKWASVLYARMFHALYECPVAILRVFMVYGPEQADRTKLIPYVADASWMALHLSYPAADVSSTGSMSTML